MTEVACGSADWWAAVWDVVGFVCVVHTAGELGEWAWRHARAWWRDRRGGH